MDSLVTSDILINDHRHIQEFKTYLITGLKKTTAISGIESYLIKDNLENAVFLAYQLLASGHLMATWEKLSLILFKKVKNPRLIIWYYYKNKYIHTIINNIDNKQILQLRNSQIIRNIITEFILLIYFSNKNNVIETLKKKPNNKIDFNELTFLKKLKFSQQLYKYKYLFGPNDTKETYYVINEIRHHLQNKNIQSVLYWIEWLYIWEKINIKQFKEFKVQNREIDGIESKYNTDISWFIWSVLFDYKEKNKNGLIQFYGIDKFKVMASVLNHIFYIYCYNWKPSLKNKKKLLITIYINYLLNPYDYTIPLLDTNHNNNYLIYSLLLQEKYFLKINNYTII